MRSSIISVINCIGGITIIQYLYKNTSYLFNNWWSISIAVLIFALLSAVVLHQKVLLAIGATGTVLFLTEVTSKIIVEFFNKDISLIGNITISLICIILISILVEILTSSNMSIINYVFDCLIGIVAVSLYHWLIPMIADATNLPLIKTWCIPIVLIIFFVLVICINFKANLRNENINTHTALAGNDENDEVEDY